MSAQKENAVPKQWAWQADGWLATPAITDDLTELAHALVCQEQDLLTSMGEHVFQMVVAQAMAENLRASYAIEGEHLDEGTLRSSVIQQMNLDIQDWKVGNSKTRKEEAAVKAALALLNAPADAPLTVETICSIHAMMAQEDGCKWGALRSVNVGVRDANGTTVYVAPDGKDVARLMREFCDWWNMDRKALPAPVGAALAHLFLVEIHPFEDGNGRMARMLFDKALTDGAGSLYRPYSISTVIEQNRGAYYRALDQFSQHGNVSAFVSLMLKMQSTVLDDAQVRTENIRRLEAVISAARESGITITPVAEAMLKTMAFDVKRTNWNAFEASRDIKNTGGEDAWDVWSYLEQEGIIKEGNINYGFPAQRALPAHDTPNTPEPEQMPQPSFPRMGM